MNALQKLKSVFGVSDVSLVDENLDLLDKLSQLKLFLIYGNIEEIRALQKKLQFETENILQSEGENGAMFNQLKVNAPNIISVKHQWCWEMPWSELFLLNIKIIN